VHVRGIDRLSSNPASTRTSWWTLVYT